MNVIIRTLFSTLMLIQTAGLHAQKDADPIDPERLEGMISELVGEGAPGLAVGIVRDGEVVFEHYAGLADLEHAVSIGPATRFNIASNAKQFTALATLDLIEQGRLSLDDDMRKFIPELYPDASTPIRIRHLLTHTSGLRDVYDLWALTGVTWWRQFIGNDDALELLARQRDLNFEPGGDYLYSNSNYIALAEIIARITESDFDDATRGLFDRLEMSRTGFVSSYMTVIPDRARGYGNFGRWVAYPAVTELQGDGWLYTTLKDQLLWERRVQSVDGSEGLAGLINRSQQRLSANSDDHSTESSSLVDYGFGVEFDRYKGERVVFHDGSTGAHNASFSRFPDRGLSIVAMSNNGQISTRQLVNSLADDVLAGALEAPRYSERPDTLLERPENSTVLGLYDNADTGLQIRITAREGELYREIEGRDPVKLLHEEGNVFQYETNLDLRMSFDVDADGQRGLTIYYASQEPQVLLRKQSAPDNPDYRAELVGEFVNTETGARMVLELDDDQNISGRAQHSRYS